MSFIIRPATEHDLPAIQNIYNAEVLHGMAKRGMNMPMI